jgi:hypothetical protein
VNELGYQKLVIDAVKSDGGFAFKLSNRFLSGIPDLLVQLPGLSTHLWEVKLSRPNRPSQVTPLQRQTLLDYYEAGGKGGVLHFDQRGKECKVQAQWLPNFIPTLLFPLKRGQREKQIVELLRG